MWKIRNISIDNQIVIAPMAGISNPAFRSICKKFGAGLIYTEMVSDKAICYSNTKTIGMTQVNEDEHPLTMQLFGHDIESMVQAAVFIDTQTDCDILDINMGCPVPKVANSGDGSGLMRDPDKAVRVLEAVVRGAGCPVTVKFRLGWDKGSINCVEFARTMEEAGAAAVAVHGRTRNQMYAGTANWDWIREVKRAVKIPVLANGDVFKPSDAPRILKYTGADMAMIGRGVFGNPWLFAQCRAALEGREIPPMPPLAERCDTAVRQFELSAANKGEKIACLEARRHYAWYLKGVPHAGYYKEQIVKITSLEDVYRVTRGIKRDLADAPTAAGAER